MYIPPIGTPTGSIVVIANNGPYQTYPDLPYWLPFIEAGAAVLLWNPAHSQELTPAKYASDLDSVVSKLIEDVSITQIGIKSYCASCGPAIQVAINHPEKPIHLIIDRGGDSKALFQTTSTVAHHSAVNRALQPFYSNEANLVQGVTGTQIFISPSGRSDSVMTEINGNNLTRDLYTKATSNKLLIETNGGHWSRWDKKTWDQVLRQWGEVGIVRKNASVEEKDHPPSQAPSLLQTHLQPFLTKAWLHYFLPKGW